MYVSFAHGCQLFNKIHQVNQDVTGFIKGFVKWAASLLAHGGEL